MYWFPFGNHFSIVWYTLQTLKIIVIIGFMRYRMHCICKRIAFAMPYKKRKEKKRKEKKLKKNL